MAVNWDEIEGKYNNFKQYVADGKYKVKCDGIELKEVGTNGSVVMKFHFEEGDKVQYPTADHWLSFKNPNWRAWHNRCLMEVLGASDEAAKKAVEACEKTDNKDTIMKSYEQTYKKLLAKKPEVEIEVYTVVGNNGKDYARADFADRSVAMPKDDEATPATQDTVIGTMEEADDISLEDLPF